MCKPFRVCGQLGKVRSNTRILGQKSGSPGRGREGARSQSPCCKRSWHRRNRLPGSFPVPCRSGSVCLERSAGSDVNVVKALLEYNGNARMKDQCDTKARWMTTNRRTPRGDRCSERAAILYKWYIVTHIVLFWHCYFCLVHLYDPLCG